MIIKIQIANCNSEKENPISSRLSPTRLEDFNWKCVHNILTVFMDIIPLKIFSKLIENPGMEFANFIRGRSFVETGIQSVTKFGLSCSTIQLPSESPVLNWWHFLTTWQVRSIRTLLLARNEQQTFIIASRSLWFTSRRYNIWMIVFALIFIKLKAIVDYLGENPFHSHPFPFLLYQVSFSQI